MDADGRRPSRPDASSSASTCPGIEPDSLDVEVERNVLTVRAERSWSPGRGRRGPRPASARRVRSRRQVMLGDALDTDRLEATYDAGVLSIAIPVAEQAKARKVEIQQGAAPSRIEVGSATN